MAFEDVKSPLPPRRYTGLDEIPAEEKTERLSETEPLRKETVAEMSNIVKEGPVVSQTAVPNERKSNKVVVFGLAGIALIIIGFVVVKVLLPLINKGGNEEVTLNYWGLWEEPAVIEGLIADYEASHPGVKINYIRNQRTNYRTRLQTRLETEGSNDESPDIFRIHDSWLPMFKSSLAKVPAETANAIGLDSDYFDTYKEMIKQGGNWLAVPLMYDGLSLFYNKDLVESGQVSLPKSWWDLEMAAGKLTVRDENGKIKVAGAALGLTDNVDQWSDILGLMLKQGGVDILANDGENNKKLTDVLTYYTLFRTKNMVWDESLPSSTEFFANGKLAFYFGPSWRVFNIEEMKIPDLNYAITTVPQLQTLQDVSPEEVVNEADLTNIHWATYWVEGVNAKSSKQQEAWDFLTYLSTKENLEKFYAAASQIRAFGEIYPRKSMADGISTNPMVKPFVTAANRASGWYLSSRTYDDGLNDEMIKYFKDAINAMVTKNETMDDVLPDLRNGISQLVTKYGLK